MVNKDFLRQILKEDKELIEMPALLPVSVPLYDELSITNLWPHIQQCPRLMRFFPDHLPKGRLPDREYTFNVLNTLENDYVKRLIAHANEQRHGAGGQKQVVDSIEISNKMESMLEKFPF